MTDVDLGRLADWLDVSPDERTWMHLAHDLMHAGPRVRAYVETLEADRFGNELCDQRIEKLRAALDQVAFRRSTSAKQVPLLYQPKGQRLLADDEETNPTRQQ